VAAALLAQFELILAVGWGGLSCYDYIELCSTSLIFRTKLRDNKESYTVQHKVATLPRVIAHRGASDFAPENTLSALRKAAELGATWVECDVMLDGCGEAIIFHDRTLQRTTNGRGRVSQTPYNRIRQLDAGTWFDAAFKGEVVPTLAAWLETAATLNVGLNLELKVGRAGAGALVEAVSVALARHWHAGLPTPLISSASIDCLVAMRHSTSHHMLAYITNRWRSNWAAILSQCNGISLNINHRALTPKRVQEIKEKNILVLAYTVNDVELANALFDMGVDVVFSDNPRLLLKDLID
jgi:glycerophosphoryl diester phosphodiesterase